MIKIDNNLVPKDKVRKALKLYDDFENGKLEKAIKEAISNEWSNLFYNAWKPTSRGICSSKPFRNDWWGNSRIRGILQNAGHSIYWWGTKPNAKGDGLMRKSPAKLHKCNAHKVMEEQLTISVMQLVFIMFLVFLFFIISILVIPKTYGFL